LRVLGVGSHDPVLDPVVDHLHEVAGAVGPAVQIAVLGGAGCAGVARGAGRRVDARRDGGEDRVEVLHHLLLASDHQAEAPLEPEHAAAGPDVDVVDALAGELLGPGDVVAVVGVTAVDDDVVLLEMLGQVGDDAPGGGGGDHDPRGARPAELRREVRE
jgi:hypothetical protein